jgi:hypothetical protein
MLKMGHIKGLYNQDFSIGENAKIASLDKLKGFIQEWKYHHPLVLDHLKYAGRIAEIEEVGFYHCGD